MITPIPLAKRSLLEMAAHNNGFDRKQPDADNWLVFTSTQCPLRIWLGLFAEGVFVVGFSQLNVHDALSDFGAAVTFPLPAGALGGRVVTELRAVGPLIRRAFQLSKSLPDEPLHRFEKATAQLPKSTEAERLVVQRVGQNIFRDGLLEYWQGRCAVTGLDTAPLLRASHIKPWADCATDAERLDVYNGLLLAPHLDAAFDRGFITFDDDGVLVVADRLAPDARRVLGLDRPLRLRGLTAGHRNYLPWHRARVYCG